MAGAIVVRGGRVTGQGFNEARCCRFQCDSRARALKTGSIAEEPSKPKRAYESRSIKTIDGLIDITNGAFHKFHMPFENVGGGDNVNAPLTILSEMMTILSTLSDSAIVTSLDIVVCKSVLPGLAKRKAILHDRGPKKYTQNAIHKTHVVTE